MTSRSDRERLRGVAAEYAEIVTSETMDARREVWRHTNRLEERTIPFVIEDNGTFFADLTPAPQCEGEVERGFESQMLRTIANVELVDDDRVFPPYFPVNWAISRPYVCPELRRTRAADATGRELGYETNRPLADLANSFDKLVAGPFSVNREATLQRVAVAKKLFGDIIPAEIIASQTLGAGTGMAGKAVTLMGMDTLYMAMIDQPENVHRFFDFVATEGSDFLDFMEREELVRPNYGEYFVGSGSYGYTDELPRRELAEGAPMLAEDCWGFIEAQEAVGISPDMFAEFIFPYQRRLADRFGLVYYGCCEPVHEFWPTIRQFNSLRKITISPWCDQEFMADALGKEVVFSRKPHPIKLAGPSFDPKEFEEDVAETLAITKHNFIEIIFRDTCRLCGEMKGRVADACRIMHRLIGR